MKKLFQKVKSFLISPVTVGLVIFVAFIFCEGSDLLGRLNYLGYDIMLWKRGTRPISQQVVIVDIDEKSLTKLGRWPWPRPTMAKLLKSLSDYGAKTVALDISFSESDQASGLSQVREAYSIVESYVEKYGAPADNLKVLDQLLLQVDSDQLLADTIRDSKAKVVAGFFMNFPMSGLGIDVENAAEVASINERIDRIQTSAINVATLGETTQTRFYPTVLDLVVPIPQIAQVTHGFGYFNDWTNKDNTSRSIHPIYLIKAAGKESKQAYFPSLSLLGAAFYLDSQPQLLIGSENNQLILIDAQGNKRQEVPLDRKGRLLTNYYGPSRTFPYLSAVDVIEGAAAKESIANKLVFIGASSAGVHDLIKIPLEVFRVNKTAGVEMHATLAENIISGDYLNVDDLIYMILLILVPLLLVVALSRSGPLTGLMLTFGLIISEAILCYWLLLGEKKVVWVASPMLALLVIYIGMTLAKYSAEESKRRFIKKAFEHYLSPAVIDQIVANPDQLQLKGERRRLTILFSDIRDFTTISEQLSPQALHDLLTAYLTPMTEIILNNSGTLDKYIGDAVMAFYGAPIHTPLHPKNGCRSALEMMLKLRELLTQENFPNLQIGIGLNTGEVSVGNMGSTRLFDYTVLGDAVNLASRLEGVNKVYGTSIIVSQATYEETKNDFIFRELDRIQVKGKQEVVTIHELMGDKSTLRSDDLELRQMFHAALQQYRRQEWKAAQQGFQSCLRLQPRDSVSALFIERVNEFMRVPPLIDSGSEWDGVYRLSSK